MSDEATYLFNPAGDMALASGIENYTPPARIIAFEAGLSLLPALYAPAGSAILVHPSISSGGVAALPYFNEARQRSMQLIYQDSPLPDASVVPWSWNKSLAYRLRRMGLSGNHMPSPRRLERWRELSHRRLTIDFHQFATTASPTGELDYFKRNPPLIFTDMSAFCDALSAMCVGIVKAPWSSSGKGVFQVAYPLDAAINQRVEKIIKTQGAVMLEPLWNRVLDCATEWECHDGEVRFLGYSVFQCSRAGAYKGNMVASPDVLRRHINAYTTSLEAALSVQESFLKRHVAPFYDGPVGIDMLTDRAGNLNPCVEVNLRHTMGYVALMLARNFPGEYTFTPGLPLNQKMNPK